MVSIISSRNLEEAIKEAKELSKRKYEEAIICQFCYENPDRDRSFVCMNCSIGYGRLVDWLEELKELREYKEKYRWNDLRKNPDDLPEDNKQVLVSIKDGCIHRTWHDSHGWRNRNSKIRYYSDKSVLAWREIEEFESEEEDEVKE